MSVTSSVQSVKLLAALCLALVLAFLPTSAVSAEDGPALSFAELEYQIGENAKKRNLPSVTVVLAKDGEIVFESAYGLANEDAAIEATVDTPYSLASISKTFTALAVMHLVQQGKIDLDAPINQYLGKAKIRAIAGDEDEITVRRVLNHTAGLPLHYQFFYSDTDWQRPSMDETIALYGVSTAPPGSRFNYSNLGYGILDYVIERISGQPFGEFLKQEVFTQLGMTHSGVITPGMDDSALAVRYGLDHRAVPLYDTDHRGASNVYASARDLARFGMFLLQQPGYADENIVSAASLAEMVSVGPAPTENGDETYGLGINVRFAGDRRVFSHSGGMPGVATTMTLFPDQGTVVVVLINSSAYGAPESVLELRDTAIELLDPRPPAAPSPEVLAGLQAVGGAWSGAITTPDSEIPFRLSIGLGGIIGSLGDGPQVAGSVVGAREGLYSFAFREIRITTGQPDKYPHGLLLAIEPHDGGLIGSATAYGATDPSRMWGAISYPVELESAPE